MSWPIGSVVLFAGNFAPAGWLACDGSLLPSFEQTQLFEVIGTAYGSDGGFTYRLPKIPPPSDGGGVYLICVAPEDPLQDPYP